MRLNGAWYSPDGFNTGETILRNPELHAWAVTDVDTPKDLKAILWREGGF
jgi:hypothetical protein